ncbi:MAG: type I restriction endonuclease subunit R, partial [Campylobacterales bacterium]|nr:type I restriction endonuclease subunit R [Campylobacterales bacterium]
NFNQKTHRLQVGAKGFNAMFAVSSVDAAKLYYEAFKNLQKGKERPLRVATIFSFAANEVQDAIGDIEDETFEPSAMDSSAKEFLSAAIDDYNKMFKTSYGVDSKEFANYYKDLAKRVKGKDSSGASLKPNEKVDLLIVVGMFLTGFDAPTLNTLFVDKNLRYHGLMQAYSRTNRIYDATKTFGNIVTFRDLEQATIEAIRTFGDDNTKNIVLEKSYDEYMKGFTDIATGEARRGYLDIVKELEQRFPDPEKIEKEKDKKDFAKLFGEYLKAENVLQNYDEFMGEENKLPQRLIQDYKSTYNDIREWIRREKDSKDKEESTIDWNDIVFEIDLLKSQEINLDYILELIFEHNKKVKDKVALVEEVHRVIRASLGNRAKESLVVDFINQTNLDDIGDKASVIDEFFKFAQAEQLKEVNELISDENLNEEAAKRYIMSSLKKEYASENGTELNAILPKMSPLNPQYLTKKQKVFQKIAMFVEKFKGVGGKV